MNLKDNYSVHDDGLKYYNIDDLESTMLEFIQKIDNLKGNLIHKDTLKLMIKHSFGDFEK